MSWSNFHHHCHYCDGKESPERHVQTAITEGLVSMGFSSHCPVPFVNSWSMKKEDLPKYLEEISELKEKYKDQIQIYKSLEIDFIPNMISPNDEIFRNSLDYTIGSIHYTGAFEDGKPWEIDGPHAIFLKGLKEIYDNDPITAVCRYFYLTRQMIKESCPDIVGHLDKIKMHNQEDCAWDESSFWYRSEINRTLEEIRHSGAIIEVNTRGLYKKKTIEPYPGKWALKQIHDMGIPICLNSDAHHPSEMIASFGETAILLQEIGFKQLKILFNNEWIDVDFDQQGLKL